jgi:hypothetical protein
MQPELPTDACFHDAEAFGELAIGNLAVFMGIDQALTDASWKGSGHHLLRPSITRPSPADNLATIHSPWTQHTSIHFAQRLSRVGAVQRRKHEQVAGVEVVANRDDPRGESIKPGSPIHGLQIVVGAMGWSFNMRPTRRSLVPAIRGVVTRRR